jgi:fucose permease
LLLSVAAYAGMFVFGIVMALLGAILPSLSSRLHFEMADIGTLFLVMNAGMLASSLVLGLIMDRFGMKLPLAAGAVLVASTLFLIASAHSFTALLPPVLLLGIGGASLNGGTNTLVADLHSDAVRKSAALNRLGVFFGFGALFLPFVIGALLASLSLEAILAATAGLCAAAAIFTATLRFPAPKQRNALPLAEIPGFLRSPLVLSFGFLLFLESGSEFTLGGFISMYLARDMAIASVAAVSWILAGYWASIMISRAVLSRVSLGMNPYRTLLYCAGGAGAGALLAAIAPGPGFAAFAILLCGCSLAGVYPSALGIVGARFQSHSGTVFGILFAVALAGGMLLPWVAGQVGGTVGLRWVFGIIAAAFVGIVILSRVGSRVDYKNRQF